MVKKSKPKSKSKSIMEEGSQRRSARLSAVDKWHVKRAKPGGVHKVEKRAGDNKGAGKGQGLPGKKRGRKKKKKKLREVKEVVVNSIEKAVQQAGEDFRHEGEPDNADKSPSRASCLPEKRVLELILNTLQKKDTHEIFAEPVDPEEVEGYYDIIKNPMDFGTMRAKLHEGMYTSLEQFESDVFLICSNAMHFNSSSTIFFRQARSIQELAKKTFYALRTDPDNFESEFSSTRRRHYLKKAMDNVEIVKSQTDTGNSDSQSHSHSRVKSSNSAKPSSLISSFTLNDKGKSLRSQSGVRNLHEGSSLCSPLTENRRICENLSGIRDGRKSNFAEEERRSSRPWSSFSSSDGLSVSTTFDAPRQLSYVNQGNFSYAESLLWFVKDLGPTAQAVAYRKLQKCQNVGRNFQTPATPLAKTACIASNSAHIERNDIRSSGVIESQQEAQSCGSPSCSTIQLGGPDIPSTTMVTSRISGNAVHPEFSQSRLLESMLRIKSNNSNMVRSPLSWPFQGMKSCGSSQAVDSAHSSSSHTSAGNNQVAAVVAPELNHRLGSAQMGPHTVLNMSYLQAKLGVLNSWGLKAASGLEMPTTSVSESACVVDCEKEVHSVRTDLSNHSQFEKQPDLALQL